MGEKGFMAIHSLPLAESKQNQNLGRSLVALIASSGGGRTVMRVAREIPMHAPCPLDCLSLSPFAWTLPFDACGLRRAEPSQMLSMRASLDCCSLSPAAWNSFFLRLTLR